MKPLLIIPFLFSSFVSFGQFTLQGFVYDRETDTPLPGANVFIASTTYGVSSEADGSFKLSGLKAIHYQLVVSFVGYGTQVFDVIPGPPTAYKIYLTPTVKTLNEVVVRARKISRAEWLANLKIFKEHFIGLTENSNKLEFENPRVLDLDIYKGKLTAYADSALVLVNNALGYRVKVLLNIYEYNMRTTALHYEGQMIFEALTPSSKREESRWAKNRLEAYYGSQMHFLRSLYNDRLNEEGFYYILIPETRPGKRREVLSDTVLSPKSRVYRYKPVRVYTLLNSNCLLDSISTKENSVMNFKGDLQVTYIHEAESKSFQTFRGTSGKVMQTSQSRTLSPAYVQSDGSALPSDAIQVRGYWSWELIAESLPLNYSPEEDEKLLDKH